MTISCPPQTDEVLAILKRSLRLAITTGSMGLENHIRSLMTRMGSPYEDTLIEESVAIGEGVRLIAAERLRQITEEGWTAEHDDRRYEGNIGIAGATYAMHACCQLQNPEEDLSGVPAEWPWDDDWWKPSTDPVRNLTKAGALITAEIDRLQRLKAKEAGHAA